MIRKIIITATMALALSSCTKEEVNYGVSKIKRDPIDRERNLTRDEYRMGLRPYDSPTSEAYYSDNGIGYNAGKSRRQGALPDYLDELESAKLPIKNNKKITLSVTEDVPLRDILIQIARQAELEIALDPEIQGGIILSVKQRPVSEVIEMIADLGSLRYEVESGILKISKDRPYLENYRVDFINLVRSSKGKTNSQTKVLSVDTGAQDDNSGAFNSGSSHEISTTYDGDLWASIQTNMEAILGTQSQALLQLEEKAKAGNAQDQAATGGTPSAGIGAAQLSAQEQIAQIQQAATISRQGNVNTLTPEQKTSEIEKLRSFYSINKQAGIISVMTTQKKHKEIKHYLDKVKLSLSGQVLIEAKLVEVSLYDRYGAGINWRNIQRKGTKFSLDLGKNITSEFTQGVFRVEDNDNSALNTTLEMIEEFGTTRTLSNPRITALNNQQALFTFAKNQPYFTVTGTLQQQNTTNTNGVVTQPVSVTSTLRTVPIGVILALQPSINLETQEITMNIRPTLSRKSAEPSVKDPAITILNNSLQSGQQVENQGIPIIEVRELDTVMTARSGDVMVLGGLIEHVDETEEAGLPFVSKIPLIGNLTKHSKKRSTVKETVILIQATIVPPKGFYHQHDKKMYKQFIQDPRPFDM